MFYQHVDSQGNFNGSERRSLLDLSPSHRASLESASDLFAIDNVAFQTVRSHLSSLEGSTDTIFLKTLMDSPVLSHLIKVQDKLEEEKVQGLLPVSVENLDLLGDICEGFDRSYRREGQELSFILRKHHFKALVDAHDRIARELSTGNKEPEPENPWEMVPLNTKTQNTMSTRITEIEEATGPVIYAQPIRVISLRKSPGQPLGVTVEEDGPNLVVARILSGGLIDRCRLMKVGDVLLEVNSIPVRTPQQLQTEVAKARDKLILKVGAPNEEKIPTISGQVVGPTPYEPQKSLCFMRALFSYDPALDTLLPCKEIGLGFNTGEILQIMDQSDPNWWQAKKIGESAVGLVPSRELEERRAAFVRPEADFVHSIGICGTRISRKKKRNVYATKQNSEYDKAELSLYEEVTRMPPFRRKTLVLVGAEGVGRRTLKNRLLNSDPNKFATITPITSRPPLDGEEQMGSYIFVPREAFEEGIKKNEFLEFGEKEDNYYGTSFASVNTLIRQGKMVIMDCNPTTLKILHSSPDFMPYVVFLAAPGAERIQEEEDFARRHGYSSRSLAFDRMSSIRYSSRRARTLESVASLYEEEDSRLTVEESQTLQRLYAPYFDLVVVNEDFDATFRRVAQALDALSTDHQWVPVTWVY